MSVNVLHHGRCFDGAASAALFSTFFRQCREPAATFRFLPKRHQQGDPFSSSDFLADTNACVDFRYTQRPALDWYFDHHLSAFQLPGDSEHFKADRSGQKFHDPKAISCASYLAKVTHEKFGFDASPYQELIRWADMIDSAAFPDPETAVCMKSSGMQIAAFIQHMGDLEVIQPFISDLINYDFKTLSSASYIRQVVDQRREAHQQDIGLIGQRATVSADVLEYNLLDCGHRIFSHFIPYHHHPRVHYAVGVYQHSDADLRLTVGFNPWLPAHKRHHDLARICEKYGGGGHPHVAGCSFAIDEDEQARSAFQQIIATLRAKTTG